MDLADGRGSSRAEPSEQKLACPPPRHGAVRARTAVRAWAASAEKAQALSEPLRDGLNGKGARAGVGAHGHAISGDTSAPGAQRVAAPCRDLLPPAH